MHAGSLCCCFSLSSQVFCYRPLAAVPSRTVPARAMVRSLVRVMCKSPCGHDALGAAAFRVAASDVIGSAAGTRIVPSSQRRPQRNEIWSVPFTTPGSTTILMFRGVPHASDVVHPLRAQRSGTDGSSGAVPTVLVFQFPWLRLNAAGLRGNGAYELSKLPTCTNQYGAGWHNLQQIGLATEFRAKSERPLISADDF
jgi:hypothetical protein